MDHKFNSLEKIKQYLSTNDLSLYSWQLPRRERAKRISDMRLILEAALKHDTNCFHLKEIIALAEVYKRHSFKYPEFRKWSIKNINYVHHVLEEGDGLDDLCLDEDVFNLSYSYLRISENWDRYDDLILSQLKENPEVIRKNIDVYLPMLSDKSVVRVMSKLKLISKNDPVGLELLLKVRARLYDYMQINDVTEVEAIRLFILEREKIFLEPFYQDLEFDRFVSQLSDCDAVTHTGVGIVLKELIQLRSIQFETRTGSTKEKLRYHVRINLMKLCLWVFFEIPHYAKNGYPLKSFLGLKNV